MISESWGARRMRGIVFVVLCASQAEWQLVKDANDSSYVQWASAASKQRVAVFFRDSSVPVACTRRPVVYASLHASRDGS